MPGGHARPAVTVKTLVLCPACRVLALVAQDNTLATHVAMSRHGQFTCRGSGMPLAEAEKGLSPITTLFPATPMYLPRKPEA